MGSESDISVERRQAPRKHSPVNKILQADLTQEGQETASVYVFLVDVSAGGMRLNVDRELPDEAVFQLGFPVVGFGEEVERLSSGRITVSCEVVWKRELVGGTWVHGLKFLDLDDTCAQTVRAMMEGFSPSGRRKRFRLNRLLPVAVKAEGCDKWCERYASDLSPEGLGIQLDEPLPEETDILVKLYPEFDLPVVQARARVAWTHETEQGRFKMGLRFQDIEEMEAQVLQRYIDRCLEIR